MTRRFDSFVIIVGFVFPCDTLPQIKEAEAALVIAGLSEARIHVGLPPKSKETPLRIYAHNAGFSAVTEVAA